MFSKFRILFSASFLLIALVVLPTLAMAAPTASSVMWDNTDKESYFMVTFSEDLSTANSETCDDEDDTAEGTICYPATLGGTVSFNATPRLQMVSQMFRYTDSLDTILVAFTGRNAFDDNASVQVTIDGVAGISNQTFDAFLVDDYDIMVPNDMPPMYLPGEQDQIELQTLSNFNNRRYISEDCAYSVSPSYCFETDSVTFHDPDDDSPITPNNTVLAVWHAQDDPRFMYVELDGSDSFTGLGVETVRVKFLEDPPGLSNDNNAGTTNDLYFLAFSISGEGGGGGGGSVPEMGVWALLLILPILGYLAYSVSPQGVKTA